MLSETAPNVGSHHVRLAMLLESVRVEELLVSRLGRGRPARFLRAIARSFVIKAHLNFASTKQFLQVLRSDDALRSLCGFWGRVPSESAFSRGFAYLAQINFGDAVHVRLVNRHESETLVFHVARDSSAIEAREKSLEKRKPTPEPKVRMKPGPKKKGEPAAVKVPTRQERQLDMDAVSALSEIPRACDRGTKRGSKGDNFHWTGYKFHADVTQDGVPLCVVTTSASVHDCQLAIPMMKTTAERVARVLYQLMDAGYVGKPILEAARRLDQVAIVFPKATPKQPAIPMDEDRAERFKHRTSAERFFSDLKDNRGGNHVRVKGHRKVHLHLMFGVIAIMGANLLNR